MRKWLSGVALFSFLLCLCASACAVEPSDLDYEGFAVYLQEQGFPVPQTWEEAAGDDYFGDLPKYELIVDEENDQYILRTDLVEGDIFIDIFSRDTDFDHVFQETDEPGVYAAHGIGDHTTLFIHVYDEKATGLFDFECYYDLTNSDRCTSYLKQHHLTDTIDVSKEILNRGDGTGSLFLYYR